LRKAGFVLAFAFLQSAAFPGTISGIIVKAGTPFEQPLRNARLELTGGLNSPIVMRTDLNGRFQFSNLAPGEYRLTVTCDGFIRQEFSKRIVVGRGQSVSNVRFELEPAPTAAGRVLDIYGLPIPNIVVEALRRGYDVRGNPRMVRASTAVTDDRGEYRVFWLDAGEYFFYASSPLPDGTELEPAPPVAPTYYPGVTTPDDAKPLRLDIGREVRVDFRLRRDGALWNVNGQTMNAMTSRSVGATITLTPPSGDPSLSRFRGQSSVAGPYQGQFSIGNVPPGSYIVTAKGLGTDEEMTASQRIVLRPLLVTPREGYTVPLRLRVPFSINGRFLVESREAIDLHQAKVGLVSIDPDLPSPRSVLARPEGQFTLSGVVAGSYVLEISDLPQDLYMKAARFGSDDILANPLTLESKETVSPLQVLLGTDGGRLPVDVSNSKGEPQSGAQFVLVPDNARRNRRDQYRLATSDADGHALIRGIPPGNYKLFAWESLEPNAYLNSDFLAGYEASGVPVKIASGDNLPVSARLIPKE